MLRQKMVYADKVTTQFFKTKDSLQILLGRQYEQPLVLRKNVLEYERTVDSIESVILNRLEVNDAYFMTLSIKLARLLYLEHPTLEGLACYTKIRLKGGDKELANQLYQYALKKRRTPLKWQQIRDQLSTNEVAIQFVSYHDAQKTTEIRYAALVLRKNYTVPRYVFLCTQTQLNTLFMSLNGNQGKLYYKHLYTPQPNKGLSSLYNLLWQPLEPLLSGIRTVNFALSGDLHRLNIAAIHPNEKAQPLSEQFEFVLVNSMRSLMNVSESPEDSGIKLPCLAKTIVSIGMLARLFGNTDVAGYDPTTTNKNNNAVLFGNINYEMDSSTIKYKSKRKTVDTSMQPRGKRDSTTEWTILDGTKSEIDSINNTLTKAEYKVTIREGRAASEESFKQLGKKKASPRIIHIATHGFFLADKTVQLFDNQMNYSGLVLAGANYAWKKGAPMRGKEDGILTAFEIGIMNLQSTELVVLSACETGLGYIVNNEGVVGLQRAFKQAGVKNLLVSLWSISDDATQKLMTRFYENCLAHDMSMRDALKAAQKWMREQEGYENPYYWAGFVLLE